MTQPFARRLRDILIRERLNPADVARRLGGGHKDEVAVSNWLSGRNEPTLRNLLATQHHIKDESALLFIFFQFVEKVCLNCLNHFVAVT